MSTINFNNNNFSTLLPEVKTVMQGALDEFADANPKGYGMDCRIVAKKEEAKQVVADILRISTQEVFFSGGNKQAEIEIINFSILLLGVKTVVSSVFEEKAKLEHLKNLCDLGIIELHLVKTNDFGELDIAALKDVLNNGASKTLLSLSHANQYTGVLLPIKEVVSLATNANAFFHLNAGLTIGRYTIDLSKIKPDFVSFDGCLLGGSLSAGCVIVNESLKVKDEVIVKLRDLLENTENDNIALILGLVGTLTQAYNVLGDKQQQIGQLKNYFIHQIENVLGIKTINSELKKHGLFNQLAFFIPQCEYGKYLIERLDLNGFLVANENYPLEIERFRDSYFVNIALSGSNTKKNVDRFINFLQEQKKLKT